MAVFYCFFFGGPVSGFSGHGCLSMEYSIVRTGNISFWVVCPHSSHRTSTMFAMFGGPVSGYGLFGVLWWCTRAHGG